MKNIVITNCIQDQKSIKQYKIGAEQTWTSKTSEIGSGAMEECASPADRSHPPCVPCYEWEITAKSDVNSVYK